MLIVPVIRHGRAGRICRGSNAATPDMTPLRQSGSHCVGRIGGGGAVAGVHDRFTLETMNRENMIMEKCGDARPLMH